MGKLHDLPRFAFSAMEGAVVGPFLRSANGVTGVPEILGDAKIGWFLHDSGDLAAVNAVAYFGGELKLLRLSSMLQVLVKSSR